jgi:hypothetical protein
MVSLGFGDAVSIDASTARDHELSSIGLIGRRFLFRHVPARRPSCGEQNTSIGFIGDEAQQSCLLIVLLDEGQSSISDGAGVAHHYATRRLTKA